MQNRTFLSLMSAMALAVGGLLFSPAAMAAPKAKRVKAPPGPVTANLSDADAALHEFNPAAAKLLLDRGVKKLLFVRRFTLTNSHVYTEHIDARWTPGGGLCVLDLETGAATELFPELGDGVTNRFDLSFDAQKIVFDFKKSEKEGYRIYEANIDGSGLRQLTFPEPEDGALLKRYGYGTNDMHPCYLPDGSIIFTSTRCRTSTLCNSSDVYTTPVLYRMDADGGKIRQLSSNCVSEFSPAVLPDGRVLYMRWEYNRKGAGAVKCLWAMWPDGTGSAEVYGNQIVDPETMIYGRPIPGTADKIVFLGCSHWGPNNGVGTVIKLDTKADMTSPAAMTRLTKDVDARTHGGYSFLVDGKWVDESTGTLGPLFKDPYPLSEQLFLVAHKPKGLPWHDPKGYGLTLLDGEGRETPLYRDLEISCWHPYPLAPRAKPPMPYSVLSKELAGKQLAQCLLTDVYSGLDGVKRGEVKYLRILEQTPRPWTARNRWQGDREGMAHTSLGPNILGMHAQHGVVPVEEDGSANFYVPAGRNIYFQALDANFMALQTERTYVNYQPGELRSCVGCHETARAGARNPLATAKALRRAPSLPAAQPGDARGAKLFDYERQIQPLWDKHCVSCHDATPKAAAGLDLTGELTGLHNRSYESLLGIGEQAGKRKLPLVGKQADENDIRANVTATPPRYFGAYSSLLAATFGSFEPDFRAFGNKAAEMRARVDVLRAKHKEVKLAREEFIRIANWLDASCQYYGSYWGMKNIAHRQSPYFRPEVTFEEAIAPRWPASLNGLYEDAEKPAPGPTAAVPGQQGMGHRFVCADYVAKKLCVVGADGKVEWEYAGAGACSDVWGLPNGNVLFSTGSGVKEVTPDKKTVFEYKSTSEVYACQRLANGNTFVGECSAGRLLEIAPDGKTVMKEIRLLPAGKNGGHGYMRNVRVLANGHYLVTHFGEGVVREYDGDGKIVRSIPAPGGPHSVAPLANGNVLIATGDYKCPEGPRVFEVDPSGKTVWELKNGDLPGIKFAFMTGFHRLPNGNTVISNWLGHNKFGTAPHLIEVTPDKKVIWTFADHTAIKTVSSVQFLDLPATSGASGH